MPNRVGSSMTIIGSLGSSDEIDRFLAKCFSPDRDRPGQVSLDFEKIIPSHPAVLALDGLPHQIWRGAEALLQRVGIDIFKGTCGSGSGMKQLGCMTQDEVRSLLESGKRDDLDANCVETARLIIACRCATGCPSPSHWSALNWGTKSNALYTDIIQVDPEELEVRFATAWSAPRPIFRKLGQMFPGLEFHIAAIDPAMGSAVEGLVEGSHSDFWHTDVKSVYESVYGEPIPDDEDEEEEEDEVEE